MTKVLVIDDDQGITDMLRLALPLKGFKVAAANSGREGIEAVRQHEPDVIVLDLMIPDIDGWHVCKAIREFSQVPILVLSAVVDPEKINLVKRSGTGKCSLHDRASIGRNACNPAVNDAIESRLISATRHWKISTGSSTGQHNIFIVVKPDRISCIETCSTQVARPNNGR